MSARLQRQRKLVGRVVRDAREDAPESMTQEALARSAGWTKQALSRIELGDRRLDLAEMVELAEAMHVDPHEVLDRYMEARTADAHRKNDVRKSDGKRKPEPR